MAAPESVARAGRGRIGFILFTIFLDATGIGLLIPILPQVLQRFSAEPSETARLYGFIIALYAIAQFVASPVLGALSDRYGRRPVLLVSLLAAAADYLFLAFAPSLPLLLMARLIAGLTGASMTVASSYMVDISRDDNRATNFGLIGAAWGVGFIGGPVMGGVLARFGIGAPFAVAASLNFVNFLFGLFVLPESLAPSSRRKLEWRGLNPLSSLLKARRFAGLGLLWIYLAVELAMQVHGVNWALYTQAKFGWTAWDIGVSLAFVGLVLGGAQGALPGILIPRWGELRATTVGLVFLVVSLALYGAATKGWMIYVITAACCLAAVTEPALKASISKEVPMNEQGELQGTLVSLSSLATIAGPLVFSELFVRFNFAGGGSQARVAGAAYYGAAAIAAVALASSFTLLVRSEPVKAEPVKSP
jgi:DHA1 family tetracycline resistance protein-like MFS transporter